MIVTPLDTPILVILMAAGAAIVTAGLWLMFRPKPEGGTARIELFGMKFESSSAGLLVFLIGAAFLATPLLVPRSPLGSAAPVATTARSEAQRPVAGSSPERITIESEEVEPNDTIAAANLVSLGSVVTGELTPADRDFFAVDMPEDERGTLVASLTINRGKVTMQLLDEAGAILHTAQHFTWSPSGTIEQEARRPRYHVALINEADEFTVYQMTLALREQ